MHFLGVFVVFLLFLIFSKNLSKTWVKNWVATMGIIITSLSLEYERLSLELYFSYLLNLKVVRFNSYAEPKRNWVSLWLHPIMVRDRRTIAQRRVRRGRVLTQLGAARGHVLAHHRVGREHVMTQIKVGRGRITTQITIGCERVTARIRVGHGCALTLLRVGSGHAMA